MRLRSLLLISLLAAAGGIILGALLARVAPVDEEQARICRAALPALSAEGAEIAVTRIGRGPAPDSVRIDYRATEPGRPTRARLILCGFADGGFGAGRTDLVSIATERGRMSDASLFFLKRYWLDQPGATFEAPDAPLSAPLIGRVPRWMGYGLQQLLAGLPVAAVTGLMATAYALVYGLIGRIILSFGEFAALGAAGTALGVAVAQVEGLSQPAALALTGLLVAAWATATWGAATARLALAPMAARPGQHVLIATIGLALFLSEGLRLTQGHAARWLPPIWNNPILVAEAPGFGVIATPIALAVAAAALAAAAALVLAMRRSRYGRAWRACADDPLAAALCGVDRGRTIYLACAFGCGVAGLAGFLLTLHIGGVGFAGGAVFGLKALVGAVIGGVGSIGGALAGGLIVGALEIVWSATMPIEWRDAAVLVLLSLALVFRPGGLFGEGGQIDRPQGRAT